MSQAQMTWLVTGSSRGIGLGIVTKLASDPSNIVIASCRDPERATQLRELASSSEGTLHVIQLDTSDESSILAVEGKVTEILGAKGLDYLVQNAAISAGDDRAFDFKLEDMMRTFRTNVAGPAILANTLLPHLERGRRKVVANITSGLASFELDFGPKNMSYTVSKTALNMLVYKQAKEKSDLTTFVIDPGWVKTDMGGPDAQIELHESVSGLIKFFERARPEHSSGFYKYDGTVVPR